MRYVASKMQVVVDNVVMGFRKGTAMNDAFSRDTVAQERVAALIKQYGITTAVETGTYQGHTTQFLAQLVSELHTVEVNPDSQRVAKDRCWKYGHIHWYLGESSWAMREQILPLPEPVFFFLDAHWGPHNPLLDELDAIAKAGMKRSVIMIHDCFVPGTDLGYDQFSPGVPISYVLVEKHLSQVFGGTFVAEYNTVKAQGARRGILYAYRV